MTPLILFFGQEVPRMTSSFPKWDTKLSLKKIMRAQNFVGGRSFGRLILPSN